MYCRCRILSLWYTCPAKKIHQGIKRWKELETIRKAQRFPSNETGDDRCPVAILKELLSRSPVELKTSDLLYLSLCQIHKPFPLVLSHCQHGKHNSSCRTTVRCQEGMVFLTNNFAIQRISIFEHADLN